MRLLILLISFTMIAISNIEARERIIITKDMIVENPITFENKIIIIEKKTNIIINTEGEYALHLKNSELIINGDIFNPVTIRSKKIDIEQNVFYLEDSKAKINNTVFEQNGWCIHAHNSDINVENTLFRNNFGGIRFFNSKTTIKKNIFEKNEIAIRFLNSNENNMSKNLFYNNKTAIFIREGIQKNGIKENAFIKNVYDFYTGFFQSDNLSFPNNYFYDTPSVFDNSKDSDLMSAINVHPTLNKFPDWH